MSANYCSDCGSELSAGAGFCSECGASVGTPGGGQETELSDAGPPEGADSAGADLGSGSPSDTMFKTTAGLVAAYFAFVVLGVVASIDALVGLGALCLVASLVTMYVDLRDLEDPLWDTRPILWTVGAALLYVVVAPLYVYKRRQVA